jgi:hypothetical protein
MAEKKIIELEVKNNLGSLKSQLREAQAEVAKLSEQFGVTSKQVIEAAKRAAELKDRIEDANDTIQSFKGEGAFLAAGKAINVASSGIASYQGALGLLGVESEKVQETLLKVQSAMALTQGLAGLEDAGRAFTQLGAVIKNQVVTAFATLKSAMMTVGIGLVIAAIGTAIYLMDKYNDEIEDNIQKQKRLNEENKKYAEQLGKVADARQKDRNAAKGGLNDKERELQLLRAKGATESEIYKKEKEIINKRIFDQNVLFNTFIGNNEVERQKRKEAQDNLKNLYNESKALDLSYTKFLKDEQTKRLEESQKEREERLKAAKEDFEKKKELALKEAAEIILTPKKLEDPAKKAIRDARKLMDAQNVINEEKVKQIEAHNEEELRLEEEKNRKKQQLTAMSFDVISGIANLFAQGNEEDQRKAFQLNKAASLAQAIMNTAQGVTGALTAGGNPIKLATGAQFLEAGLVGTIGALNIAKIANTQFQGGNNAGGGNTPIASAPRTPSFDIIQAQPQMQLGALQQQPIKAYVVSGEVSTAQALDRNRVRNATF